MPTRERSWEGLEELRPVLLAFLRRRCRDSNEAEDILQETLLRAARYRGALVSGRRLRPWALRIAGNVLADHVRRESRLRRPQASEDPVPQVEWLSAEDEEEHEDPELRCGNWLVDKQEALECLVGAMAGLGPEDQRVLDSFYRGAGSCRETARECSIPFELVKVRLFRARKRLLRAIRHRISTGMGRRVPSRETP